MKKIVFIIDVLGVGGAERLLVPVLSHLQSIFEVRVCVFRSKDGNPIATDILELGVPVDDIKIQHLRDLTALPRLIRYLRQHTPDLVHTQLEFADILGGAAARFLKIPCVSTIHTLPPVPENRKQWLHQQVWWTALKRFSDHVIAVSDEARRYFLNASRINPAKVSTIYNGIDFSKFRPTDQDAKMTLRRELKIPPDAQLLTTVAMLRSSKGIQYMIRAMSEILASNPNTYYLVVGSGAHLDVLQEEADNCYVSERVIFTGVRVDVPEILSISDVFVLPTLTEALPTVLAEAMASRKPIVASAVGGVPEMVVDGRNGFLVNPGAPGLLAAACSRLLQSSTLREAFGSAGWELANQKFNILSQIKHLQTCYSELMDRYG